MAFSSDTGIGILSVKIPKISIFDANLRFALLASLRSAMLSETEVDNELVTFDAWVKHFLISNKK